MDLKGLILNFKQFGRLKQYVHKKSEVCTFILYMAGQEVVLDNGGKSGTGFLFLCTCQQTTFVGQWNLWAFGAYCQISFFFFFYNGVWLQNIKCLPKQVRTIQRKARGKADLFTTGQVSLRTKINFRISLVLRYDTRQNFIRQLRVQLHNLRLLSLPRCTCK